MTINDVCNYITVKVKGADAGLNNLKLQKLLYYVQAWHLAFYGEPQFAGKFQAWIHGPVNREIYNRFSATKNLYSEVTTQDVPADFEIEKLPEDERAHIDSVLEAYAPFRDFELEEMTHREEPWIEARQGYRSTERCEVEIKEETMRRYYASRITK
jgi:uncharacterized phage-associated protein